LITGNSKMVEALESHIANYHQAETGLVINSGYMANLGLFSCLPQRLDTILYDRLCHASIRDGIRLSSARAIGFEHNDVVDLEKKISRIKGQTYIAVESVYSMDGDFAPLERLAEISKKYGAALIVDEAHAIGIHGPRGAGRVVEKKMLKQVFARIVTFGKALGGHGAIILGPAYLREYLINFCRPFIYTTALPPINIYHIKCAYDLLEKNLQIEKLNNLLDYFNTQISNYPSLPFYKSNSVIKCLKIAGNENTQNLAAFLKKEGFEVKAILHPTVPLGQERLRICLHAFNTTEEILRLLVCLSDGIKNTSL